MVYQTGPSIFTKRTLLLYITIESLHRRLSHGEAAETFSELLAQLPPGRLRCSALLNRALLGRSVFMDWMGDFPREK
jgi:hypothetical protein